MCVMCVMCEREHKRERERERERERKRERKGYPNLAAFFYPVVCCKLARCCFSHSRARVSLFTDSHSHSHK